MKHNHLGFAWAVVAGLLAAWAAPVFGQAQSQETGASGAIEEIIVTARRREESLSDVPGTVTALTADTLERAGVQRADDFIDMVPGVSIVDAAEVGDTQVNIRGINGARDAENSFAFILDGVLYTNPAAFNREYTNLKQIEVFKGPQGAIYGRNAAAGAIIVTTETPGAERKTNLTLSTAEDSTNLAKFSTSGPLFGSDNAFFQISADWRETDGYYRNSFQDNAPIVDAYEGHNVHARLVWEPSEKLTVDTKLRLGEVEASSITFNSTFHLPVFAQALNNPPAFQDVNDFDFVFHPNIVSDNDQDALEFSSKFDYELQDKTLTGWLLYSDIDNNLMSDGTSAAFGFYNPDPVCQQSVLALNAAGQQLLAPQFIGTSPVGVIFDPVNGSFLGAYTPTTCDGIQEQVRNQKDFSMELRLASDTDAALQWMAGAYFLDIDREVGVSLNRDSGALPTRGLYQAGGPNATAALIHDQFDSRVYALFGALEYDVNEAVELSLALRYDKEERDVQSLVPFNATQNVIDLDFDGVFNDPLNPALSSLINSSGVIAPNSETFEEFQPKVSLTWDVTDNTTLYGSWGVGFKAGGFNNSGSQATVDIFINGFINGGIGINFADQLGVTLPTINDDFREETSTALEIGFKSSALDGALTFEGAAYNTKVDDMQFFEFFVGTFGLLRVVSNIDEVDITGYELGSTWHATDHLRFYGGASFVDSEIKANTARPGTVGNESPYTPDQTINLGADFDFSISDTLTGFARIDAQHVGETWFHTVQEGQRPTIFMPLFELGFGAGAGALGIADVSNARRDAYTTLDLRAGIRGDNWAVTLFGSNITDEKYIEEAIPAPEFGGVFNHPGPQRRYGVEFSYEF